MPSASADVQMKMGIVAKMTELLADAPFDEITVSQICDAAHISRSTFYRHFESKDAVPLWHVDHIFRIGSFEIGRTLNWFEGHYITLTGIARFSLFYRRLELPNGCPPLRQHSTKTHVSNLRETLVTYRGIPMTDRLEFQVETFCKTRTNITKEWIYQGLTPEPSIFAEYTNSIVPPELFALLDIPSSRMSSNRADATG